MNREARLRIPAELMMIEQQQNVGWCGTPISGLIEVGRHKLIASLSEKIQMCLHVSLSMQRTGVTFEKMKERNDSIRVFTKYALENRGPTFQHLSVDSEPTRQKGEAV